VTFNTLRLIIGFCFIIGITSCDDTSIFEANHKIDHSEWDRDIIATFEFDIEDTNSVYELYLNFRHGGDYPYRNLYLFTHFKDPDGKKATDTAQMLLADSRGVWMGKGIGGIYDYQFKFKEGNLFPRKGKYTIQIEQAMRTEVLLNVTDIGVDIKKK